MTYRQRHCCFPVVEPMIQQYGLNILGEGKHRLQSGFWDFSRHHNFIPRVCRPYRAQTKGKVERFIHYLKHSFYHPLVGELKPYHITPDVGIANQRVLKWLNTVANWHSCDNKGSAF